MKRKSVKLALTLETVRRLTVVQLTRVAGGNTDAQGCSQNVVGCQTGDHC